MKTQTSTPTLSSVGARGREGIKRYRRRNERFLRNDIQYFQEIIQTTFQNVETYTNPPTGPTHGRETDGRRRTRKQGPRTRHQVGSSDMSRRAGPGQPGSCTATDRTSRRVRGTKGQQPRSRSLARTCCPPGRQQVLHKEDTERQHKCTEPKGHKTDRFVTESYHPRDQGIRSQKETEIDAPAFTLQPAAT